LKNYFALFFILFLILILSILYFLYITFQLSFETAATTAPPAVEEDVTVPALELPAEEASMLVPQQTELDKELEPLHSSYVVPGKRPKKRIFIDQRIALSDEQLLKWRQDVKSHCTVSF